MGGTGWMGNVGGTVGGALTLARTEQVEASGQSGRDPQTQLPYWTRMALCPGFCS